MPFGVRKKKEKVENKERASYGDQHYLNGKIILISECYFFADFVFCFDFIIWIKHMQKLFFSLEIRSLLFLKLAENNILFQYFLLLF